MSDQVFFIHGALSSAQSWNYVKYAARRSLASFHQVKNFDYRVTEQSAYDLSEELAAAIKKGFSSGSRTFLIGHSFGGCLAVEAVRILAKKQDVSERCKIMTLATPLGGSGAASLLRVFKPSSMLYRNVGAYDGFMLDFKSKPLPCKTYSIITSENEHADFLPGTGQNDGVVTKDSQEYFNSDPLLAHKYLEHNHFEVLLSPKVGSLVNQLLSTSPENNKRFEENFQST